MRAFGSSLALILALLAPAVWAADENLPPDGENNPANVFNDGRTTACSVANCETDVDEGASGGGDDLDVCTETQNATIRFDFPTPSADPDPAADAQILRLIMTRIDDDGACTERAGGSSPSFSLELYCNGTATAVLPFSDESITAIDQTKVATFTFPGACAADGSDFQILLTLGRSGGSPAGRNWAGIEAIDWEVTHAAGNVPPTATIDNPADAGSIGGGASYVVDGTSSDADGTVQSVSLTIARPSGAPTEWWNGSGWQGTSTTVAANDTGANFSTWDYTWNWSADMDGTSVAFTAEATDDLAGTGSDTNTANVDTEAPRIATAVRFQNDPTSGDASFTLLSNWTEANAGTPRFAYDLNNTGVTGWSAGSAGNSSSISYGVGLTGSDYFVDIRSDHTDSFGNGPTLSQDSGPFYVLPLTPNAPTVANNGTTDSLDVTINANPGEGGTGMLYAIKCDTAGGFVQTDNTCDVTETWRTAAAWGSPVTVTGLIPDTLYTFSVAAGNPKDGTPTTGERSASVYGGTGSDTTDAGNQSPTATIDNPADAGSIGGGASYVVDGTSSDADGTVQSVSLTIARPSGAPTEWWNGSGWQGTSTTVAANDTGANFSTWDYTWNWSADMDGTSVAFTAEATDDLAGTGSDTNTANVDTEAPRIATAVRFQNDPTSGDASFTLLSNWTEVNAGTPRFAYDLNNTGVTGWSAGSAGNSSSISYGVGLTGSDYFVDIRSDHTDSFGNGPTLSQDSGPFYVLPLTPNAPTVANNGTTDSLDVTINANPGEGGTGMLYAIKCDTAGGFVQTDNTCDVTEVWRAAATWGSPVTVTGLNPSTLYAFSVAAGNPKDGTPTTGERSASVYGGTGSDTTDGIPTNDVTVNPPTAAIDNCNQITVTVTFTGDDNNSSTTVFERSPNGVDSWAPVGSCGAVGGTSPRSCVDTTVTDNSTSYYRTDFTDTDGIVGTDPSAAIGPYDTSPYCSVDGTTIDDNDAAATTCELITTTSLLTGDDDGDGYVEVQVNTVNSFPATIACAQAGGASPRQCRIPGLTASQDYWLRFRYVDPDGVVAGAAPQDEVVGPVNTGACAGDGVAPTLMMLAPSRNAVIGGTDRIKLQVYDVPIGGVSVTWSVDGGGTTAASQNANYDCGTDCAVYEFDLNTTTIGTNPQSLANGSHYLTLAATDSDGHTAELGLAIRVNNTGDRAAGSGMLLRRTHGSQLCIDCHNLPSHSSQNTSNKYGNWAMDCTSCHTPHRTTNIYLIDGTIETPNSGSRPVRFENTTGAVADSTSAGTASYVNEDNASEADGVCQVCHTRTEDEVGDARWRNAASGGNVDTHFISTGTSQCTQCHTHDEGFSGAGGACNACHHAPPAIGKHSTHDEVWDSTPGNLATSYGETASHATATQYGYACAKCHAGGHINDATNNPTHDGSLANPFEVEVLYDDTADPRNPSGTYGGTYNANQDQGPDNRYWSWSDGGCDNLYCHSNADPLGGTPTPAPVSWDQGAALTCTSCHDTAGASTGLSNAHRAHTNASTYDFECSRCHVSTVTVATNDAIADKREHVDGEKDVFFDSGGVDNSGGTYNASPTYTCSDTYCHSDGTVQTAPYSSTSIAWNTTATCVSCHDGDANAASTMATGKHENHVDNTAVIGDNYECATCHDATVTAGDNETITGFGNHVDGTSTVSGTLVDATYTSPTCSASYCHSSGQDSGASFEYYDTPAWNTATADALDCRGCHGNHSTATVSSSFGEPDYPNAGAGAANANSHPTHVGAATDCANCHNTTTATGTSILASAPHTDQARDVVIAGAWDTNAGASNYTAGTKTCNSIACHGAGTPQWGDSLVCLDCHTGTEGGSLGDGSPNAVDDEWTTDGHGSAAGGSMTSTLGACDYCHQLDSAHTPTASINPYRLRVGVQDIGDDPNYDFGSTPGNRLCLACHETGDVGIRRSSDGSALTLEDAASDVDTAHFGTKHQQPEGGELCWDCHDPHGVPNNILMVKDQVSKSSDQYGIPSTVVSVDFADNTTIGLGGFVQSANDGMCQACHDPASGNGDETTDLGPSKYWRSDGTDNPDGPGGDPPATSDHNIAKLCTDCHFHNDDFKGSGGDCLSCHGDASGAPTRRAVEPDFGLNSHHVGASVDAAGNPLFSQPTMGGALTNFDCVVCHAEGKVVGGQTDTTGQPHMDGIINLRNTDNSTTYWNYDKDSISGASNTWMSGNSGWETQTSTALDPFCLSCHDVDGAAATFNSGTDEGLGFSGSATNPFADSAITNENDQVSRGAVVNIRNKVDAYVDNSNNSITPVDRELGTEPRTADGRPDPTDGIYSRHAIRGDGTFGSGSVYGSSQIPSNRWESRPAGGTWNDTSVMGCADCHTTDGANGTSGNAHGAGTEYLLKNKDGSSATEPDFDVRNTDVSDINCYKCHTWTWYSRERNSEHTDNNSDWVFTANQTGSADRNNGNGNIFGLPCSNCHGGFGWGSIHGTSDQFDINDGNGTPAQRQAYRFTNGASLRYFDPNDWNTATYTCYTLSGTDSFGSCTQHVPNNGKTFDRPVVRDIQY